MVPGLLMVYCSAVQAGAAHTAQTRATPEMNLWMRQVLVSGIPRDKVKGNVVNMPNKGYKWRTSYQRSC